MATVPERHEIRVAGGRVTYDRAGTGPPLLLLHGDGESGRSWSAVMPRLAERWDVIAPDLPGFGDSEGHVAPSPEHLAAWVGDLLDGLGVERAPIVGSSLGGLVAVHVALAAPARVPALVLVDAAGLGVAANPALGAAALPVVGELNAATAALPFAPEGRAEARRLLLFADPRQAPDWWRAETRRLSRPDVVATSVASRRLTLAPWGQRRVVLQDLRGISAPTLVVWGQGDLIFPATHGHAAVEHLPHGLLTVIPRCGHLPHVERPDRFLEALEPFLAAQAPTLGAPVA